MAGGFDGAKFRDAKWSAVSENLNSMVGAIKDSTRWRIYWSDLGSHTSAKYNEISQIGSGVNGPKSKTLTPLEERILQLQSSEAIDGDLVPEMGFVESIMDSTDDINDVENPDDMLLRKR